MAPNARQVQGSAAPTQTQTDTAPRPHPIGTLRLRGQHVSQRRRIQWADDVVDNEGLGRKKSKVCCIYHRPRAVGESSSEDDSSSSSSLDSDSGSEPDPETGSPSASDRKAERGESSAQDEPDEHGTSCGHKHCKGKSRSKGRGRRKRPNAYEKMPNGTRGKGGTTTTVVEK